MTIPQEILEKTAVSTPIVTLPDGAAVIALDIPGEVYLIRAEKGQRETLLTQYDLSRARVEGSPITPSWSDPKVVIETHGLGELLGTAERILREIFGANTTIRPGVEQDPESSVPSLVLWLCVPRSLRHLRHEFVRRYARETTIPDGAPVPGLMWEYSDAVPA